MSDELTPEQQARLDTILSGQHAQPMVEISQDIELPPGVNLTRPAHEYDPRVMADNTGVVFAATAKERRQAERFMQVFFKHIKDLQCPRCSGDAFRIFTDDAEEYPMVMFVCHNTRCGACWAPVHLQKAQVTDAILRSAGLWVPK